ncbi:DUF4215 domain-containing protein, partial [Myxococcota bacterium]|nr:DUF4215 domain-containing protein [Myxococcota bacterium]
MPLKIKLLILLALALGCDDDPTPIAADSGGADALTVDGARPDPDADELDPDGTIEPDVTPPQPDAAPLDAAPPQPDVTSPDASLPDVSPPDATPPPPDMRLPDAAPPACGDGALDEGEACDDGNTAPGDGCDALCQLEPACGDGALDEGEACDDGNIAPGDGCDALCQLEPACGDGALDEGEACDDGNNAPGDGCDALCQLEPFCGDGALDEGEACDDGNNATGDGCDAACAIEPFCGDGALDEDEECDDGNNAPGDGCDALCAVEPFCGDGALDPGEGCDDGNNAPGDGCDALCFLEPFCGDGALDPGEACDDGNNAPGDGCDPLCAIEPFCGDGELDPGEACDDGNQAPGDGCDAACAIEPFCGDGNMDEGEACDDGNDATGDGCDDLCQIEPFCGDGHVDEGEGCDDGNNLPNDGCSAICAIEPPRCGDGRINQPSEECDDGNPFNADGCSSVCRVEPIDVSIGGVFAGGFAQGSLDRFVFTLGGTSSVRVRADNAQAQCLPGLTGTLDGAPIADLCVGFEGVLQAGNHEVLVRSNVGEAVAVYAFYFEMFTECGNDVLEAGEGCDDGNLFNDDGCDDTCALECGNGQLDGAEDCDDGNTTNGDGCNAVCQVEAVDVSAGGQFHGGFLAGQNDVYRFTVEAPIFMEAFTHDGAGACPGDTLMGLFQLNPNPIALTQNDDSATLPPCSRIEVALEPGVYEILVVGGAGMNALPAYVLEIIFRGECGNGFLEMGEACDDGNTEVGDGCDDLCEIELYPPATDFNDGGGLWVRGVPRDGEVHYEFTTAYPAQIRAWTSNTSLTCPNGLDTILTLARVPEEGPLQELITADDSEGLGLCSRIEGPLPEPGTYRLIVRTYQGNPFPDDFVIWLYFDPVCGNGVHEQGEQCEDGNIRNGDECSYDCLLEYRDVSDGGSFIVGPYAANGGEIFRLRLDFQTKIDIRTTDGDGGCPAGIDTILVFNQFVESGNVRELGQNDDIQSGVNLCSAVNGTINAGIYEIVLMGYGGNALPSQFRLEVSLSGECGNSTREYGEDCDDGNLVNGDGCDSQCQTEVIDIGLGGD